MLQLIRDVYPYLLAFYLFESAIWVRSGAIALVALRAGRFRLLKPGLSLLGLLPTAEVLCTGSSPLAFEKDGLLYRRKRTSDGLEEWARLGYDEIAAVARRGRSVVLNRRTEIGAASMGMARQLVARIDQLRCAAPGQRARQIESAQKAATDVGALRERLRAQQPVVRRLRVFGVLIAFLFLAGLPACLYYPKGAGLRFLIGVLPAFAILHVIVSIEGQRLLRRNGFTRGERIEVLGPHWLFPPASAHAASLVLRDLYAEFDAAAVAAATLDGPALARLSAQALARLAHVRSYSSALAQVAIAHAERSWQAVLECLPAQAEPRRSDPSAAAFCPLCGAEYRVSFTRCVDCDEALRPFGDDPAPYDAEARRP